MNVWDMANSIDDPKSRLVVKEALLLALQCHPHQGIQELLELQLKEASNEILHRSREPQGPAKRAGFNH
jgi:hypothetical protein